MHAPECAVYTCPSPFTNETKAYKSQMTANHAKQIDVCYARAIYSSRGWLIPELCVSCTIDQVGVYTMCCYALRMSNQTKPYI